MPTFGVVITITDTGPGAVLAGAPVWPRLTVMGLAFLAMEALVVCLYVAGGVRLGQFITSNHLFVLLNRMVCGADPCWWIDGVVTSLAFTFFALAAPE